MFIQLSVIIGRKGIYAHDLAMNLMFVRINKQKIVLEFVLSKYD
jgi:hypothetical protein